MRSLEKASIADLGYNVVEAWSRYITSGTINTHFSGSRGEYLTGDLGIFIRSKLLNTHVVPPRTNDIIERLLVDIHGQRWRWAYSLSGNGWAVFDREPSGERTDDGGWDRWHYIGFIDGCSNAVAVVRVVLSAPFL